MSAVVKSGATGRFLWLIPAVVALALFAKGTKGDFVLDDEWVVQRNDVAHDPSRLGLIFSSEYWAAISSRGTLYRPLTILSYAVNHSMGQGDPTVYHVVNVFLHAIVSALVFVVLVAMRASRAAALAAAILFAVHPIHVEAVSNIVGRAELLSTGGVLLALLAYMRASASAHERGLRIAALAAFGAALLCKENALAFTVVPALYDAIFRREAAGSAIAAVRSRWPWHLGFFGVALGYLVLRRAVLGTLRVDTVAFEDNPIGGLAAIDRVVAAVALTGRYASLVAYPKILSYIYGPGAIAVPSSFLDPSVLFGLVVAATFPALAFFFWKRRPAVAFWALFLVPSFGIVSNIPFAIGTAFGERLLYMPSVGLLALAAIGLERLLAASRIPPIKGVSAFALVVALIAACLGLRSWSRIDDWRNQETLFRRQAEGSVQCSQISFNAGTIAFAAGDHRSALEHFRRAYSFDPSAQTTYYSGRCHGQLVSELERLASYRETAERFPESFHGQLARGWLLAQEDRYADALPHFRRAVELRNWDGGARYNLGVAYFRTGDYRRAEQVLAVNLRSESNRDRGEMHKERAEMLARSLAMAGNRAAADSVRREFSLPADPGAPATAAEPTAIIATLEERRAQAGGLDESSMLALAAAYEKLARNDEASRTYAAALRDVPGSTALLERAVQLEYGVLKNYAVAAPYVRKLLAVAPNHARAAEYRAAIEWMERRGF